MVKRAQIREREGYKLDAWRFTPRSVTPPRVDPQQRSPHESDLEGLIITPPNRRHDREEIRRLLAETSLIQLRVLDSYRREDGGHRENLGHLLVFHAGLHGMFPDVKEGMSRMIDSAQPRWIGWNRFESDDAVGVWDGWSAGQCNDFVGQESESSTPKSRDGNKKFKRVATVVML